MVIKKINFLVSLFLITIDLFPMIFPVFQFFFRFSNDN